MATVDCSSLSNGLRLHRVAVPGARAVTVLVAFDAGARAERREENGIAHLLERAVFSGGQKYDTRRKLSRAAESLGAVVGAETSHDLVILYVTARAEATREAIDLLTDFAGRPRLDPPDVATAQGLSLREIRYAQDEPEVAAELLIGRAAFGDHPLGRPVLGQEDHVRALTREAVAAFRRRRWTGAHGGAFLVGDLGQAPERAQLDELFGRFPTLAADDGYEPAPPFAPRTLVDQRDSNQSHLRLSYRHSMPVGDQRARAALVVYATLLGGSGASRLVDEIRDRHGMAYSVYAEAHVHADAAVVQLSAGLESGRCIEAYERMRSIVDDLRAHGPRVHEFERAKASAAGQRLLAFEETKAMATHAALQAIVYGEDVDPDHALRALDAVTIDEVAEAAAGVSHVPSVACVGPHTAGDFGV